jgi:glycine cleavage system H lipoate-binding protein
MSDRKCPFLETRTMTYCNAYPVKKMIPASSSTQEPGLCGTANFHDCPSFLEAGHIHGGAETVRGFTLRTDYYYHAKHGWAALAGPQGDEVKLGIDDFAQRLIGPVDAVSLPPTGMVVSENGVAFLLHSGNRTVRVTSPVDGVVRARNHMVETDPGLVNRDPYGDSWILSVLMAGDSTSRLFHGSVARRWLDWEIERLHRTFVQDLGLTMTDGGETLPEVSSHLNDAQWSRVASLFLE